MPARKKKTIAKKRDLANEPVSKSGPKGPRKGPITEKDFKNFEGMCHIQCTLDEIASMYDTTRDTIIRRVEEHYGEKFSTVFARKKENGWMSLRRSQWNRGVKDKNTAMLIFLGKQYLKQSDDPQRNTEPAADDPNGIDLSSLDVLDPFEKGV